MTTKELMVGDWVLMDMNYLEEDPMYTKTDYKPHKIQNGEDIDLACETNCIGDGDVYQPIPLTPEILEKNGFKSWEHGYAWKEIIGIGGQTTSASSPIEVIIYEGGHSVIMNPHEGKEFQGSVDSVHELQHCLNLVGIKKEIEL